MLAVVLLCVLGLPGLAASSPSITAVASGTGLSVAHVGWHEWINLKLVYGDGANASQAQGIVSSDWRVCFWRDDACSDLFQFFGPSESGTDLWVLGYKTFVSTYGQQAPYNSPYGINITLNDVPVQGLGAGLMVFPGAVSAANSNASGPGLLSSTVGAETSFTIASFDVYNNPYPAGKQPIEVTIQACLDSRCNTTCCPVPNIVSDLDDGSYNVTYVPPKSGRYAVSVKLAKQPILGSPFTMTCAEVSPPSGPPGPPGSSASTTPWVVALSVAVGAVLVLFACLVIMMTAQKRQRTDDSGGDRPQSSQQPAVSAPISFYTGSINGRQWSPEAAPLLQRHHSGDSSDSAYNSDYDDPLPPPPLPPPPSGSPSAASFVAALASRGLGVKSEAPPAASQAVTVKTEPVGPEPAAADLMPIDLKPSMESSPPLPLPLTAFVAYDANQPGGFVGLLPEHPKFRHVLPERYQVAGSRIKGVLGNKSSPQVFLGIGAHVFSVRLVRWVRSLDYCLKCDPEFVQVVRRGAADTPKDAPEPKRKRKSRAQSPPPEPRAATGLLDFEPVENGLKNADGVRQPRNGLFDLDFCPNASQTAFFRWGPSAKASKNIFKTVYYEHAVLIDYAHDGAHRQALSPGFFLFCHASYIPKKPETAAAQSSSSSTFAQSPVARVASTPGPAGPLRLPSTPIVLGPPLTFVVPATRSEPPGSFLPSSGVPTTPAAPAPAPVLPTPVLPMRSVPFQRAAPSIQRAPQFRPAPPMDAVAQQLNAIYTPEQLAALMQHLQQQQRLQQHHSLQFVQSTPLPPTDPSAVHAPFSPVSAQSELSPPLSSATTTPEPTPAVRSPEPPGPVRSPDATPPTFVPTDAVPLPDGAGPLEIDLTLQYAERVDVTTPESTTGYLSTPEPTDSAADAFLSQALPPHAGTIGDALTAEYPGFADDGTAFPPWFIDPDFASCGADATIAGTPTSSLPEACAFKAFDPFAPASSADIMALSVDLALHDDGVYRPSAD